MLHGTRSIREAGTLETLRCKAAVGRLWSYSWRQVAVCLLASFFHFMSCLLRTFPAQYPSLLVDMHFTSATDRRYYAHIVLSCTARAAILRAAVLCTGVRAELILGAISRAQDRSEELNSSASYLQQRVEFGAGTILPLLPPLFNIAVSKAKNQHPDINGFY